MKKHLITLVCGLVLSSLLVAGAGAYTKYKVLQPLGIEREESIIAIPFVLLADDVLRYDVTSRLEASRNPQPEETAPPTTCETVPETTVPPETSVPTEPPVTEPVYQAVDESWFDDALFIGDSRTTGLRDCARLGEADYFCEFSMTVFTVRQWKCWDYGEPEKTLETVLTEKQYGKVFIHLGLNECGRDHDLVMEQYVALVDYVRQMQPDAVIILQSIMPVSRWKAEADYYFAIENVNNLNVRIEALAEENGYIFSNVNEWVMDENGYMREDMTYDGSHPKVHLYPKWGEAILEDAGWYGIS